jgi:hypothetical protein
LKHRPRGACFVTGALLILIAVGCGGSGSSNKPTEHELLEQTRATLKQELHPTSDGYGSAQFRVATGTCTIDVIATGADAPAYEGYPWTVESADGEVAIKSSANEGALTEDCNRAIERAMGWGSYSR